MRTRALSISCRSRGRLGAAALAHGVRPVVARNHLPNGGAYAAAQAAAAQQQLGEKAEESLVDFGRCLHAVEPAVISMTAG